MGTKGVMRSMHDRYKSDRKTVVDVLEHCTWYVDHCKRDLVELGVLDVSGKVVVNLATCFAPPALTAQVQVLKNDEQSRRAKRPPGFAVRKSV